MQNEIYQQLAKTIAKLFQPLTQVSLYDGNHQLIYAYNKLTNQSIQKQEITEEIKLLPINKTRQAKCRFYSNETRSFC